MHKTSLLIILYILFAAPANLLAEVQKGEMVYKRACGTCQGIGVAGAPKIGDKASWTVRNEKGLDSLLHSVVNGLNGMPPKGLCMNCSEEEIKQAIEYILVKSGLNLE